ncbi:MAG: flippase-like domain-containing protein [Phycisphaerales bacterium]|nr:MAG: flippase-like domain-containing protein [Phycisphaerales bacterium]
MAKRARKRLYDALRIILSIAALFIVIQGVTFKDQVTLKDGGSVEGLVRFSVEQQDWVGVELADKSVQRIAQSDIATDEDGALKISYGLRTAWSTSTKTLFLLAIAINSLVVFPLALRFQWLLLAQDIRISYWEALKLTFAGNFLNFATPLGSNAGDVFKAYFVSLHTEHKTEAVATVALDRMIGLATLITVVTAITVFSSGGGRLATLRPYTLVVFVGGVAGAFVYLSPLLRKYLIPRKWLERLPMFEQIRRVDNAARTLAGSKSIVLGAVVMTLILQGLALTAYFTVAVALGLVANAGNIIEYYAYFYTGALVQTLPGPPQGLGTVELAYRYLLGPYGSPSQIVCVAFGIRIVVLACALPGLLVTLTGSYKPREALPVDEPDEEEQPSADNTAEKKHDLAVI